MEELVLRLALPPPRVTSVDQALSDLLLPMYRLPDQMALGEFDREVLALLRRHLEFDSAWFGHSTFCPPDATIHSSELVDLPAEYLHDWTRFHTDDLLLPLARCCAQPKMVFSDEERFDASYGAYIFRYDIGQILFASMADPPSGRTVHLSLYRSARRRRFDQRDRRLLELTIAHLSSVLQLNRRHWMHFGQRRSDASALLDKEGHLLFADDDFRVLLSVECPDWHQGALPAPIVALTAAPTRSVVRGRTVEFECDRIEDFFQIRARSLGRAQRLTPRERAVVDLFGDGCTYKQVARQLDMAPSTARHHLRQAYEKLGVTNKAELHHALADSHSCI